MGQGWLGKTIALVVGAISTGAVAWFAGRKTEKANIVAIAQKAAIDQIGSLTTECRDLRKELRASKAEHTREMNEVREDHKRCEARLDVLEQEKRELKARIDDLMAGHVPPYGDRDIKTRPKP